MQMSVKMAAVAGLAVSARQHAGGAAIFKSGGRAVAGLAAFISMGLTCC